MEYLTIIPNEYLPKFETKQMRFPKSKKRRIRNKWAKKASSWGNTIPYVITGHRLFIHPDNVKLVKLAASL